MWLKNAKWKCVVFLFTLIGDELSSRVLANEFQCYVCSSNLTACSVDHSNGDDLPLESCQQNISSCFIKSEDGITSRGCFPHIDAICDTNNNCTRCDSSKCNGLDKDLILLPLTEEIVAPKSPEMQSNAKSSHSKSNELCFNCDSNDNTKCIARLDKTILKQCPDTEQHLGCYHMTNGSIVIRGCVSDLENEQKVKCIANDDNCKTCIGNGCNRKLAFAQCIVTNGEIEAGYKPTTLFHDDSMISTKVCQSYDDKCFTLITKNNTIIRDCLNEYAKAKGISKQFLSENNNKTSFAVCAGMFCNDQDISPLECYSCDSRYDENCVNTTLAKVKQCPLQINALGCYHFEDDYIERGCLADLDWHIEKRGLCKSNSDTCKRCDGPNCNSKPMFQKCIVADSLQKMDGQSKICKLYLDECFIHVANDRLQKGCTSDVIDTATGIDIYKDCENEDICEKCSGSNDCNDRDIQLEHCIVCSSTDDFKCISIPSNEMSKVCPRSIKQFGCFLSQDKKYKTERGCVSQLEAKQRWECRNGEKDCKICLEPNCNEKIAFQKCIECDSQIEGNNCTHTTWQLHNGAQRTCHDYYGKCYTHVEDGIVHRNCTGDKIVKNDEDCASNPNCKLCDNRWDCNSNNFNKMTCVSCDESVDPTCATNATFSVFETCKVSFTHNTCYHSINRTTGLHSRGCTNKLPKAQMDLCGENGIQCKICNEPNCNSKTEFAKCLDCDSSNDPSCVNNPEEIAKRYCRKYDDECFIYIGKRNMSRGCLAEQSSEFQKMCQSNYEKCYACNTAHTDGCNNAIVPMEYCAECDSEHDDNCTDSPDLYVNKMCTAIGLTKHEGCYFSQEVDRVKRGCIRDLDSATKIACLEQSPTCKSCVGKNCNLRTELQKCFFSDGEIGTSFKLSTEKTCKHYNDACFTLITERGTVVKDCLNDYSEQNNLPLNFIFENYNSSSYNVCSSPLCNNQDIQRTQCILCDSRQDNNCNGPFDSATTAFELCPVELNSSGCYHYDDGHIRRGCVAHLESETRALCESNCDQCKTCSGVDCNVKASFQRCMHSKTDVDESKKCRLYLDDCFIQISNDTVHKGCTSELTEGSSDNDTFFTCSDDNCNDIAIDNEYCIACRDKENCVENPQFGMRKKCQLTVNKMGCYLKKDESLVERGCMSELESEQRENCRNGNGDCKMCMGDSCNSKRSFQKCFKCSSKNSYDNCTYKPIITIECPNYFDNCYTIVQNGNVTRGCTGDDIVPDVVECEQNPDNCNLCSDGNPCNNIPMKLETCISCDSSIDPSCATNSTFDTFETCPISFKSQTCFHSINRTSGIHKRGCFESLPDQMVHHCEQNGNECKTCSGSNCNAETSFKSCVLCNSVDDFDCAENLESTNSMVCKKYNDKCFTFIGSNNVSRGCLGEMENSFEIQCQQNTEKCAICSSPDGSSCNDSPISLESCIACDDNDEDCHDLPELYMGKLCNRINSTDRAGCYFNMVGAYGRGCVRDLEPEMKKFCLDQSKTCKTCNEDNCNVMKDFQTCYVTENGATFDYVCRKFDDKCITLIDENEAVVKDCLSEYAEKNNLPIDFYKARNQSTYQVCSTPLCNNQTIDPMRCISCDSRYDLHCEETLHSYRKQCPMEIQFSGCYHAAGQHTQRGCIADLNDEKRRICESDDDECKKCIGNECNDRNGFLKCITENVPNEENGQSKLCKRYLDECFTYIANETVRRGCVNDLIESPIDGIDIEANCEDEYFCNKCKSINCNDRSVTTEHCIVCSDTKECDLSPKHMREKCPLTVKESGCFLSKNNIQVKRGCMSQLALSDREACQTGNTTCQMCRGDSCNKKISFQECYDCDSTIDGSVCEQLPWYLKTIRCPNYSDHCYTTVTNGFVRRNCTGDQHVKSNDDCLKDPANCLSCDDQNHCNFRSYYPLKCVSCDSSEDPKCATGEKFDTFDLCPLSLHPTRCYHFINETTGIHKRGCILKAPTEIMKLCDNGDAQCKTCSGTECNSKNDFVRCLQCNSLTDPQCAHAIANHTKVCNDYNDMCFTWIDKSNLARGCLFEQSHEFRTMKCWNQVVGGGDHDKCALCRSTNGIGCNDAKIVMESCIECDSKSNDKCHSDPNLIPGKLCSSVRSKEPSGCYLNVDGDHYKRGCIRDLDGPIKMRCQNGTGNCKTCMGHNCNDKVDFQQCFMCDSRINNECVHNVTLNDSITCLDYLSNCLVGIDSNGHTHRRCRKPNEIQNEQFSNGQYEVCTENNCNKYIFPSDRLQCYQCNGEDECNFMTENPFKPLPCNTLSKANKCYAYLSEDNRMYRGCLNDSTEQRILCDQGDSNKGACVKCGQSGCNDMPKLRAPSLSCVKCNKSVECAEAQSSSSATPCEGLVSFGHDESCYIRFNSDENVAERGCTLDNIEKSKWTNGQMITCSQSACNTESVFEVKSGVRSVAVSFINSMLSKGAMIALIATAINYL